MFLAASLRCSNNWSEVQPEEGLREEEGEGKGEGGREGERGRGGEGEGEEEGGEGESMGNKVCKRLRKSGLIIRTRQSVSVTVMQTGVFRNTHKCVNTWDDRQHTNIRSPTSDNQHSDDTQSWHWQSSLLTVTPKSSRGVNIGKR